MHTSTVINTTYIHAYINVIIDYEFHVFIVALETVIIHTNISLILIETINNFTTPEAIQFSLQANYPLLILSHSYEIIYFMDVKSNLYYKCYS